MVSRCTTSNQQGGASSPPAIGCRAVLRDELLSLIQKYDVISSERGRLWRFKNIRLQKTVVQVLQLMIQLGPGRGGSLDRTLIQNAGVPVELIEMERRYPERITEINEAWRTWRTTMWKTRGGQLGANKPVAKSTKSKQSSTPYVPETKTNLATTSSSSSFSSPTRKSYERKEQNERKHDGDTESDTNSDNDSDYNQNGRNAAALIATAKRLVKEV